MRDTAGTGRAGQTGRTQRFVLALRRVRWLRRCSSAPYVPFLRRYRMTWAPQARRRGQALIEFTLVLGLFLMLILGLVSVGQLLLANYAVNQAARAGAHQAAITGGAAGPATLAVEQVLRAGVGTDVSRMDPPVVRCTASAGSCRRYDPITVEVVYRDAFWAPLPPLFTTFTVRAEATRASERDQQ